MLFDPRKIPQVEDSLSRLLVEFDMLRCSCAESVAGKCLSGDGIVEIAPESIAKYSWSLTVVELCSIGRNGNYRLAGIKIVGVSHADGRHDVRPSGEANMSQ